MIHFFNIYEYCCSSDKNGLVYVNRIKITNIYFWIHYANVETTPRGNRERMKNAIVGHSINIFLPRVLALVTSYSLTRETPSK